MVLQKREHLLLEYLKTHQSATMKELAGHLQVSEMTVRRDVRTLSKADLVRVVYGAVLSTNDTTESLDARYYLLDASKRNRVQKMAIARKAVSLLEPNDVVFVSYGSTTEALAKLIPNNMPLTIITNALNILMEVRKKENCKIIFLGGFFHEDTLMFESVDSVEFMRRNRATKLFTSASGVNDRVGVTSMNHYSIEILKTALASSLKKILLVDATKFDCVTPAFFANLGDFDTVVADKNVPQKYIDIFADIGRTLLIAE